VHRNTIADFFADEINPAAAYYHLLVDASSSGAVINVVNNTLVRGSNAATFPRGVRVAGSGTVTLKNTTVSGAYQIGVLQSGSPSLTEENNNVFGATTAASGLTLDASTLAADPLFEDEAGGDYRLSSSSTLRNAGQAVSGITLRTIGAAPDIGAFEAL